MYTVQYAMSTIGVGAARPGRGACPAPTIAVWYPEQLELQYSGNIKLILKLEKIFLVFEQLQ